MSQPEIGNGKPGGKPTSAPPPEKRKKKKKKKIQLRKKL
jgi:hypothetical protein